MSAAHDASVITARTTSPAATRALGAALAGVVVVGDVVLLAGDLGAGKTTLAQGFGDALGAEGPVTSPTFTLVRHHRCLPQAARAGQRGEAEAQVAVLLHADLYRLEHLQEVVDLGLGELVEDQAVALVEWGDVAEPVVGAGAIRLRLHRPPAAAEDERLVEVRGPSDRLRALGQAVAPWTCSSTGGPAARREP